MAAKSRKKRGGKTTARKTTARGGKSKSTKARARSQKARTARGGRSGTSSARSRTTARPARPRRMTKRGPGDVGVNPDATRGAAPPALEPESTSERNDRRPNEDVEGGAEEEFQGGAGNLM